MRRRYSQRGALLKYGVRSGLEEKIKAEFEREGVEFEYESFAIPFLQPEKPRKYTPDFILPNGIIIETKGRFETADRQKHLMVQQQHPDLEIRFVFSNPNQRISKQSKTTYAAWCRTKGFLFAAKSVPKAWLGEPECAVWVNAIKQLKGAK